MKETKFQENSYTKTLQLSKTDSPSSEMSLCGRSLPYASCSESSDPQRNDPVNGDGGFDGNNGVANSSCK